VIARRRAGRAANTPLDVMLGAQHRGAQLEVVWRNR